MKLSQDLSPIQVRVLGCLVEKEKTTPEQYPLTLNALKNACNQETARHPVVSYHEGEIGHAVRELESLGLARQVWSTRTQKFEHRLGKALDVRDKDVAVLTVLMLRGPQTAAEIRAHAQRLYDFADVDDVEYVLDRLIARDHPLVRKLPRQPGQKEQRFVHLLAGEPDISAMTPARSTVTRSPLEERVERLEAEIEALKGRLDALEEPTS